MRYVKDLMFCAWMNELMKPLLILPLTIRIELLPDEIEKYDNMELTDKLRDVLSYWNEQLVDGKYIVFHGNLNRTNGIFQAKIHKSNE
jgi:hypothetical protein